MSIRQKPDLPLIELMPQPKEISLRQSAVFAPEVSSADVLPADWNVLRQHISQRIGLSQHGRLLRVVRDDDLRRSGEYMLLLEPNSITIRASSEQNAFYGLLTLQQLSERHGLLFTGQIMDWADMPMRAVMIDLKRLGWNFDYLLALIERFAALKINYVLIEYEDKIKYDFCKDIPVPSAFTKEQIRILEKTAQENFIEIIPLVQCLAHYEYILKLDKYKHLREHPAVSRQACPLLPGTFELFKKMALEVMEVHPESRYFHIGADEPVMLGSCPRCAKVKESQGNGSLYVSYLNRVLDFVMEHGKIPMFWGDIISRYPEAIPQCRKNAVAIDWNYTATALRGKEIPYHHGVMFLDYDKYATLPESKQQEIAQYWEPDAEKRDFSLLPFGKLFKKHGFQTLGGSWIKSVDNVLAHSQNGVISGLDGHLGTYWASPDSITEPFTLYEACMGAVVMLGASAWNVEHELSHRKTFFERAFSTPQLGNLYRLFNDREFLLPYSGENVGPKLTTKLTRGSSSDNANVKLLKILARKIMIEQRLSALRVTALRKPLLSENCYRFVDLTSICNCRFSDTPEAPGWTGEGLNDLRAFPQGKVAFNGVPFQIVEEAPANKTLIMFSNNPDHLEYTDKVEVPIGFAADYVAFLHVHAKGRELADESYYQINYADGQHEIIPLVKRLNIGPWWDIRENMEAPIATTMYNLYSKYHKVGMHTYVHRLSQPHVAVTSIELICRDPLALLAVAAITIISPGCNATTRFGCDVITKIEKLKRQFENLADDLQEILPFFLSEDTVPEVLDLTTSFSIGYLDRILAIMTTSNTPCRKKKWRALNKSMWHTTNPAGD